MIKTNKREELTDAEYIEILNKIKDIVEPPNFYPEYFDDTTTGFKKTWSNCGFCNDKLVTKHRKENHRCPFDMGKKSMQKGMLKGHIFISYDIGCFYRCYLFRTDMRGLVDKRLMREMVRNRLNQEIWEEKTKD